MTITEGFMKSSLQPYIYLQYFCYFNLVFNYNNID